MVVKHIQRNLREKSEAHYLELQRLGKQVEEQPLSANVIIMDQTPQLVGINTILQNPHTEQVDFVFYFDRLACLMIERYFLTSLGYCLSFSSKNSFAS